MIMVTVSPIALALMQMIVYFNFKKATGGHNIFMFGSLILIRSFEYHA